MFGEPEVAAIIIPTYKNLKSKNKSPTVKQIIVLKTLFLRKCDRWQILQKDIREKDFQRLKFVWQCAIFISMEGAFSETV